MRAMPAHDREHPDKRSRPVARGAVSPAQAIGLAGLAAAASLAAAACAGWKVAAIVAVYLAMSAAYTLGLKRVPVFDVGVIAVGFMLRLLAGTLGIGIEPSNWLIACGFLLTLFLGLAKRRAEIARLAGDAGRHRAVLDDYSAGFLDKAIVLTAAGMVVAYAWYTLAEDTALIHGTGKPRPDAALGAAGHAALPVPPALARRRRRSGRGIAARSAARRMRSRAGSRPCSGSSARIACAAPLSPTPWPNAPPTLPTSSTSGTRRGFRRRSMR